MATMQIFAFEETEEIRTLLINDEPYFVANDIAKVLGYKNPSDATNKHCKRSLKRWGSDSLGRRQEFKVIPESDMYRLIIKSNLPEAEKFENWVMEEVLPTIRKHGMYAAQDLLDNPDLLIQVATRLKEEQDKRLELEQEKILLESTIAEYEPKINYLDLILSSEDTVTVSQIAQDYGMTPNKLNKLLNQFKVQYKVNKQWILTKKYKGQGFVKSKTFDVPKKDGGTKVVMDTRWTQKGRVMLYDLLKSEGYLPEMDSLE